MKNIEINILNKGNIEKAKIEYNRNTCALFITFSDQTKKTYSGLDIFRAFGLLRKEFSEIKFLCKGSKINVFPSAMSSSMSGGLVAYEMKLGEPDPEMVRIFDYDEHDLTNDIEEQVKFRVRWGESLK